MVYDLYRNLAVVIGEVDTLAVHYLVQDLTEGHLQDSSWGEPVDKWRKFLNMDFQRLNDAVKTYLITLSHIAFDDDESFERGGIHIQEHREIDITTLESKRELQEKLYSANSKLKGEQAKLKQYIERHYTLKDLL